MRGFRGGPIRNRDLPEQFPLRRPVPLAGEWLVLSGIQPAVAGRCGRFGRAGGAALTSLCRAAPAVAVPAPSLGSDLCDQRRTRHQQPNGFLQAANHRKDSLITSVRKPGGDGSAGKRTQTGRGPQFAQIRWLSPYSMLLGYGFLIGHVARTVNCCSSPMKRHPPRVFL